MTPARARVKLAPIVTDEEIVKEFLERAVENVYPSLPAFEEVLESGKRLRAYLGVDPTGPTLHMGHLVPLRKLRDLQKMGHEVILLIGDFTGMIGDPTDKSAARVRLSREEVLENCKRYKEQASVFLNFEGENPAKLRFNSEWFGKMTFAEVVELAAHFTVQQMSERDMFEKRIKEGKPVYLHEFLYPLMQGYDSVALDVDIEVGGNDQTFNMLAGRTLLKEMKGKEKFVLATALLEDPTGKKMGKSEGNMVALSDSAEDVYGKVMNWKDEMIIPGFRICTDVEAGEIERIEGLMEKGGNPVEFKHRLAKEVVKMLKGADAAEAAREQFLRVHKSHETPEEMPELKVGKKEMALLEALVAAKLVASKTEGRAQIAQGGVKVNGEVARDEKMAVSSGTVIQKGKRHFVKLV